MFIFLAIILCVCTTTTAHAQHHSDKIPPKWITKLPTPSNTTFSYKTYTAEAYSLKDARDLCLQELVSESDMKNGMLVISDKEMKISSNQVINNGIISETGNISLSTNTQVKTQEIKLHAHLIDEYWTQDNSGKYFVTTLYAQSETGRAPLFDNTEVTTRYLTDPAMWGLALVPGAAQMYKGSWLKGGLILGGSVALAGGALTCGLISANNLAREENTQSKSVKQQYYARAHMLNTGMYCCIGGLAALYVYNLIDAAVAPGARRIIVYPAVADNGSIGLGGSIRF